MKAIQNDRIQEIPFHYTVLSLATGTLAMLVVMLLLGDAYIPRPHFRQWSLALYGAATLISIADGYHIKHAGSVELAKRLNDEYHRYAVIILNGSVGAACVVLTVFSKTWQAHSIPLACVIIMGVVIVGTWASRVIRPNSFLARVRSVFFRIALIALICDVIWIGTWWIVYVISVWIAVAAIWQLWNDMHALGYQFR